jgi:hypothetical protein
MGGPHTGDQLIRPANLAVVLIASCLALTGCVPTHHRSEQGNVQPVEGGPLRQIPDHGYGGIGLNVGQTMTDGFDIESVVGRTPAIIKSVELVGTSSALQLVGVKFASDQRIFGGVIQYEKTWPPVTPGLGPLFNAAGFKMLPLTHGGRKGYELLIGMKLLRAGKFVRSGYRITYEVGGVTYVRTMKAEVTVCSPSAYDAEGQCAVHSDD